MMTNRRLRGELAGGPAIPARVASGAINRLAGSYDTPETLARIANAPLGVCRLIFAVADHDLEGIRLIRSGKIDEDTLRQRKAVIWAAKLHTCYSLADIGRALNRDHSSILRSLEDTKGLWLADASFRALCERIAKQSLFRGRVSASAPECVPVSRDRRNRKGGARA